MNDTALYATILGIRAPWKVTRVTPAVEEGKIVVHVEAGSEAKFACLKCDTTCQRHDHRA